MCVCGVLGSIGAAAAVYLVWIEPHSFGYKIEQQHNRTVNGTVNGTVRDGDGGKRLEGFASAD